MQAGALSPDPVTLIYHDVVEPGELDGSGFPGKLAGHYKLDRPLFVAHLEAIERALGRRSVATAERPGSGQVFLTFDDGGRSAYSPVADLLESRGWRGHFFITTACINQAGFLTGPQIRELRRRGHVIGSHSCHHPVQMARYSREKLLAEWSESTAALADLLGEAVPIASVPGGYYSARVGEAAAAAGIGTLFTSEPCGRLAEAGGCTVLGRYAIFRQTPAAVAGGLVAGGSSYRYRQQLTWKAKKLLKRVAGRPYLLVRGWMLGNAEEAEVAELSRLVGEGRQGVDRSVDAAR